MAIQITNDPLNSFLDNLPRYALEMRRMDNQRAQFNRQMVLKEKAAANQQTLFDMAKNQRQFESDVYNEKLRAQQDYRLGVQKYEAFNKDNAKDLESWKFRRNVPVLGNLEQDTFIGDVKNKLKWEERNLKFAKFLGLPHNKAQAKVNELKAKVDRYEDLPDMSKIKPKPVKPPEGLIMNKSLYDFAMENNMESTVDETITSLQNILGIDPQIGTHSELYMQTLEVEGAR